MLTTSRLIQVSTLKKEHAKQIKFADYPKEEKLIMEHIDPDSGDLAIAEVLGWVPGKYLHGLGHKDANMTVQCWLVKIQHGLRWINSPSEKSVLFQQYQGLVPQLFIS